MTDAPQQSRPTPEENPVLNDPWSAPAKHWRLDTKFRATDEIVEGRRKSGAYLPVPLPGPDRTLPLTAAELPPHALVNRVRTEVDAWRAAGRPGVSAATRGLLDHWDSFQTEPRPFFCQREAVETLIWLKEAGPRHRPAEHGRIRERLRAVNADRNEGLDRVAIKMATGTGKTLAMAMVIAWQGVRERRGAEVLVIAPNLTVRDRLQELDPRTPAGKRTYEGLLPPPLRSRFSARVSVLNYQKFQRGDRLFVDGAKDTATRAAKDLLRRRNRDLGKKWQETAAQMLARLLRAHRGARRLLVLNDEGHHCYRPVPQKKKGTAEEREWEEGAALWFNALRALRDGGRLAWVADFSATPMYLRLPPGAETPVFPWIVSDYPLIEAVEAGLTKVPRVPVDDDTEAASPIYRNIYENADTRKLDAADLDDSVAAPLRTLYAHYEETDRRYAEAGRRPVLIVVANDVQNATALYRWIAGGEAPEGTPTAYEPGHLPLFSNVRPDGAGWVGDPPTILMHSKLDSPDELSGNLAAVMKKQAERLAPEAGSKREAMETLRRIVGSVGKKGQPGEGVRCVVSVSMLSEGWDTRTVTHIFGFRKFGSELLCEQVAGRSLRRTAYDDFADADRRHLRPEVSNLFGVPFAFMRAKGEAPQPAGEPYEVFSVAGREKYRLRFPNLAGYRWELAGPRLRLDSSLVRPFLPAALQQAAETPWDPVRGQPAVVEVQGVIDRGETFYDTRREKEERWNLAREVFRLFVESAAAETHAPLLRRRRLFTDALRAVDTWLSHPLVEYGSVREIAREGQRKNAATEIARACSLDDSGRPRVLPVFADEADPAAPRALDTGSVCYETARKLVRDCRRSELNRAPCDSRPELAVAAALDGNRRVASWVRNDRLHWSIPTLAAGSGAARRYVPDFVARLARPGPDGEPVHLVIEYKGQPGRDSEAKRRAVVDWWIPALANTDDAGCRGTWRYCFLTRPDSVRDDLDAAISQARSR